MDRPPFCFTRCTARSTTEPAYFSRPLEHACRPAAAAATITTTKTEEEQEAEEEKKKGEGKKKGNEEDGG